VGTPGEFLSPDTEILVKVAIIVSKYNLEWSDDRQERFHVILNYNQLLISPKSEESNFNLISTVETLMEMRNPMKIELADFQAFLAASNGIVSIGKARASGEGNDRTVDAMEMALSRLLPTVGDFHNVSSVVVLVSGSLDSITVEDYQAALDVIHELISEDAEMLASIVEDDRFGEYVEVTVLLESRVTFVRTIQEGATNDDSAKQSKAGKMKSGGAMRHNSG
jgi:cell division GTPase FtsZ